MQRAGRYEQEALAEPQVIGGLRHAVTDLARDAGFGAARRAEIALAVSEAVTNVVLHAYAGGEPGPVRVHAQVGPDGLAVAVSDDGPGLRPRSDSPGSGVGLPLIARLSDRLEIEGGPQGRGTTVRLLFAHAAEGEEPGGAAQVPAPADAGRPPVLPALEAEAAQPPVE